MQKRVLFSSFLPSNLSNARSYLPDVPTGLLALSGILGLWSRSFGFAFGKYDALHPNIKNATQQQIYFVHRLKKRAHVWTVNEEADLRRLFKWGVERSLQMVVFWPQTNVIGTPDSNLIQNNFIQKATFGFYIGANLFQTSKASGNIIKGNMIGSETDSLITFGIQAERVQNTIIEVQYCPEYYKTGNSRYK